MARMRPEQAERLLAYVPVEYTFRCCDGSAIGSLEELCQCLEVMGDETFAYHSNDEKRDFGNWARDVLGDTKLARDLDTSSSREQASKRAGARFSFLMSRLG
jgi:hypothetical protein